MVILFEDGTKELGSDNVVLVDDVYKLPTTELTKKGNRVFIKFNGEVTPKGKDAFHHYITRWGYWRVVEVEDFAHFVLEINIEDVKHSKDIKTVAVLKTRTGEEIDRSTRNIYGNNNALTGLNAERDAAKRIVKYYLRKKFKV